ncbi:hypothetical protein EB118_16320 [bacterium]|nr:hypothetical protein [bacterium]NDC95680.1 hypothetical protein [bacterium]NDD85410.1 hypothetical protein [bacterium]NDG31619.1 hypothetical protein [bacterium]
MKTRTFTATVDNKEITLLVRAPSLQDQREATKVYNTAFSDAIKAKAVVRAKLDDLLVEQGLWDDKKQFEFSSLQSQILENERKLAKGGIPLSEAKKTALEMRKLREDLRELIGIKTNLDTHTAEGQADNARFNYLVSACTVYNDNKRPYFNSYDDYLNRATDPVAILAAQNLAGMLYGLENDYEDRLPENKFLKQYKFVDDKLRLINKDGKLVDEDGRLIDELGRFINDNGELVDKDGIPLNQAGDYVMEFKPFLDDNGNPINLETNTKETVQDEPIQETKTTEGPTQ